MRLIPAGEVMEICARKMDVLPADDLARPDVRALYSAAALISTMPPGPRSNRTDYRVPVPDWLVAGPPPPPPAEPGATRQVAPDEGWVR